MFVDLSRRYPASRHAVQQLPAIQLSRWLDEVWYNAPSAFLGFPTGSQQGADLENVRRALAHPQPTSALRSIGGRAVEPSGLNPPDATPDYPYTDRMGPVVLPPTPRLVWQHLIYAYLIESTGAFDIMAEVARRLVAGESLGRLSRESIVWLRNTEELFFRDPPLFSVSGIVSDLRPSASSNRRNAYWRMFGMDLPHQPPPGWPGTPQQEAWKQHATAGVNTGFQEKLVELLRQVWVGIVNVNNTTGANPVDPSFVSLLCRAIGDMLRNRRLNGLLAREEFVYVSFLSWFHLTLIDGGAGTQNAPIVKDLQAEGTAPEERLNNLAMKVGMKPAPRSRELFQIAERMSILLRIIELGGYDTPGQAAQLYVNPVIQEDMRLIINNWQSATGQRIKDQDSVTSTPSMQPFRAPSPAGIGGAPNGNGRA